MAHEMLTFITWKTWGSLPGIDHSIAARLIELLPALAMAEHSGLLEIAVLPTHVHVVAELTRRSDIPQLVQRLKGASARFANRDGWSDKRLRWDRGYDARSMSRGAMKRVRAYLDDQPKHHELPMLARWSGPPRVEQAIAVAVGGEPALGGASAPI